MNYFLRRITHPAVLMVLAVFLQVGAIGGAGWIGWYSHEKLGPRPEPIILHVKDPAPVVTQESFKSCIEKARQCYAVERIARVKKGRG